MNFSLNWDSLIFNYFLFLKKINSGINQASIMPSLNFHKQKIAYLALGLVVLILFIWINSQAPETTIPEINNPKFSNVQSFTREKTNTTTEKIDKSETNTKAIYKILKQVLFKNATEPFFFILIQVFIY